MAVWPFGPFLGGVFSQQVADVRAWERSLRKKNVKDASISADAGVRTSRSKPMLIIISLIAFAWLAIVVFVVCVCQMAAKGDGGSASVSELQARRRGVQRRRAELEAERSARITVQAITRPAQRGSGLSFGAR
jgi:hypothetical protein